MSGVFPERRITFVPGMRTPPRTERPGGPSGPSLCKSGSGAKSAGVMTGLADDWSSLTEIAPPDCQAARDLEHSRDKAPLLDRGFSQCVTHRVPTQSLKRL